MARGCGPAGLIDGVRDDANWLNGHGWASQQDLPLPQWVEIVFPQAEIRFPLRRRHLRDDRRSLLGEHLGREELRHRDLGCRGACLEDRRVREAGPCHVEPRSLPGATGADIQVPCGGQRRIARRRHRTIAAGRGMGSVFYAPLPGTARMAASSGKANRPNVWAWATTSGAGASQGNRSKAAWQRLAASRFRPPRSRLLEPVTVRVSLTTLLHLSFPGYTESCVQESIPYQYLDRLSPRSRLVP